MQENRSLSIIIVTYNSEKYISNCLISLITSTEYLSKVKFIIIDNCSVDKTLIAIDKLKKKYNKVDIDLIKNESNLGFSKAVNNGIKTVDSDLYLLVNPDIQVSKETIKNILKCQNNCNSDIVGVKTVDFNGKPNSSYFRKPTLGVGIFDFTNLRKLDFTDYWHRYFYYKDKEGIKGNFNVDIVTGGFMLIRKELIKKIGLFDEDFFMYLEDVDFCVRALESGSSVCLCDEIVRHYGGGSSNNKERSNQIAWIKSRSKYFYKHFNNLVNIFIQPIFILDSILIMFLKKTKR